MSTAVSKLGSTAHCGSECPCLGPVPNRSRYWRNKGVGEKQRGRESFLIARRDALSPPPFRGTFLTTGSSIMSQLAHSPILVYTLYGVRRDPKKAASNKTKHGSHLKKPARPSLTRPVLTARISTIRLRKRDDSDWHNRQPVTYSS